MLIGPINAKGNHNLVQKRCFGEAYTRRAKIGGRMKHQLKSTRAHGIALHQGRINTAIIICRDTAQMMPLITIETVEVDIKSGSWTASCRIQNMRRQSAHPGSPFRPNVRNNPSRLPLIC